MKHGIRFWQKSFGLKPGHKSDFTKNVLTNLIVTEQVKTTIAKAKFLKHEMECWIERAKNSPEKTLQDATSAFGGTVAPQKLVSTIAARYKDRKGGYVRIIRSGNHRPGTDRAPVAFIELVGNPKDLVQGEALLHGQKYVQRLKSVESSKYHVKQIPLFVPDESNGVKTIMAQKLIPKEDLRLPELKKLTIKEVSLHKKLNKFEKAFPVVNGKKVTSNQFKDRMLDNVMLDNVIADAQGSNSSSTLSQ